MPKISFRAKLYYAPSPLGINIPIANASVQLIDVDAPGRGDDVIWSGTTDASGAISGESSNWQDTIRGPFGSSFPDPTDMPSFKLQVSAAGMTVSVPFAPAGSVELPVVIPIVPQLPIGKVNNRTYQGHESVAMSNDIYQRTDAGDRTITVELYGATALMFAPLAQPLDSLKTWVRSRLSAAANPASHFGHSPEMAFWILVGVALIIGVVGASAIGVLLGLALIYAIHEGYSNLNMTYSVGNIGGIPVPTMTITLTK